MSNEVQEHAQIGRELGELRVANERLRERIAALEDANGKLGRQVLDLSDAVNEQSDRIAAVKAEARRAALDEAVSVVNEAYGGTICGSIVCGRIRALGAK